MQLFPHWEGTGFWKKHAETEQPLRAWFQATRAARWQNTAQVKGTFRKASVINSERVAFEAPDPVEAIEFRMEQAGYDRAAFVAVIGSPSRASEILNRKRPLTVEMIWKLVSRRKIPAESLVRPYRLRSSEGERRSRKLAS